MPIFRDIDCGKLDAISCNQIEIMKFIQQNTIYPPIAESNDIEGKVKVKFAVDTVGKIIDIEVIESVDPFLDEAAIELKKKMDHFYKPGYQGGEAVKVQYILPINYNTNTKKKGKKKKKP